MDDRLTGQTVELLQTMIRNACVNEGTVESGQEIRNAEVLASFLDGSGADVELFHAAPGRTTLVARVEGSDPSAPSLCLNGHTDVVPVSPDGWSRDPFAAELVDGEIWGRGAVDMLNLTASMAVAVRHLLASGLRPRGDLVLLAVADEESGSRWGARWMAEHHADLITTDFVLTENGGLHGGSDTSPTVSVTVGEKGVAWRRLTVRGTPGHGSMPFRADNALVTAAGVVSRLAEYRPPPMFHELWRRQVAALPVDDETRETLLDPDRIDDLLATMPGPAGHFYSCTHTTFSPNTVTSQSKTNVIPDTVTIDVDVRTLPGEGPEEVEAHLRAALGDDLFARVEVEPLIDDRASTSRTDTPLWDALQRGVARSFDRATLHPQLSVGFTDARVHRELGAIAYGAGLLSPNLSSREFGRRFHGNDERIDVESLGLTTRLWIDVVRDLLG
ncbi:M20/M25/M40 family metallo-hydrolase [Actinomarinicola tropica]|nr:M20/M25/M40 family metallo-hydrolase [Actinomarinicola tropica]